MEAEAPPDEREPGPDPLLAGLLRLLRQLDRPCAEAELRSAALVPEGGADPACLLRIAEGLGFAGRLERATRLSLGRLPTPFLLFGREPGHIWLARARAGRRLVLVEPVDGGVAAYTLGTVITMGNRVLRLTPAAERAPIRRPERSATRPAEKPAVTPAEHTVDNLAATPADHAAGNPAARPADNPADHAVGSPAGNPLDEPLRAPQRWRGDLFRRLRPVLAQIVLASVVSNLLALATPLFMMTVYNQVIRHSSLQTLDVLAIGMASLFLFDLVLRALRGHLAAHTGARLDAALGTETMHHLTRLPYRAFETMPAGQMLERFRQLDQLRQFLTGNLPLLLVDLAFVGLFVAALLVLSPTLGLVTVGAMPLFVLISAVAHRRQMPLLKLGFRANAGKASALGEAIGQALTVKALGLEQDMERRFEARLVESAWAGFRTGSAGQVVGSLGQGLQQVTALVLVYLGARMIIAGELSVGALVAANILSARALAPMRQLFLAWTQLQQAREAMRRLDGLLGEAPEATGALGGDVQLGGRVSLEEVTFRYAEDKAPALAELSLTIEPGTVLGVVGAPGSGKSTLAKLILGLERPSEGRVLLDDLDLRTLAPAAYRQQIGVVPQEVQLFAGTIAENIALGAADRGLARVIAAARFVGAHDFIQRLPEGYDTVLGERGIGLSLGQRQLIAIARALVRNPRLLILDEATSALDGLAEAQLLGNLRRAGTGRTVILITHRPAVLEICDQVIQLEAGRIARVGTPGELAAVLQARARRGGLQVVAAATAAAEA